MNRLPLFAFLLLLSAAASADGIARLKGFLSGLITLQAQFEQSVTNATHDQAVYSRGSLYLKRPGRFRWEYAEPAGQFVVADGDRVWLYDAELAQVSHQSQADALRGTPALLLSDTAPLEDHFDLVDLGFRSGYEWVELLPRARDSEITKVQVAFDGERLDRLEMIDNFGQITRFRFGDIRRNPDLPDSLFRFVPPPEVDILEQ